MFGPRAIGVVLTGNLDDGTAGLWAIKQLGGMAIVQDPADALYRSMPESALRNVNVDRVVPVGELAPLLVRLTSRVSEVETVAVPEKLEIEVNVAKEKNPIDSGLLTIGNPSRYACPECHGVLLEIKEAGRLRFVVTRVMRFRPRASSPRSATAPKRRCGTRSVRSKKRGC